MLLNMYYFKQKTEMTFQALVKAKLAKEAQKTETPPQTMRTGHLCRIRNILLQKLINKHFKNFSSYGLWQ